MLLEGDNLDSDDEAMFEQYRQKRMEQLKKEEKRGRYGTMEPLAREDFVREVTDGSKAVLDGDEPEEEMRAEGDVWGLESDDEDEEAARRGKKKTQEEAILGKEGRLKGTGVVVFLFKDSYVTDLSQTSDAGTKANTAVVRWPVKGASCAFPDGIFTGSLADPARVPLSQHLRPLLIRVAAVHPSTKFLSIPAGLCIPNYPDKNVPTLLVYRNGEMLGQVVAGMGLNGMRTTVKGESPFPLNQNTLNHGAEN